MAKYDEGSEGTAVAPSQTSRLQNIAALATLYVQTKFNLPLVSGTTPYPCEGGSDARTTHAVTVKVVVKRLTDDLIAFDSQDFGRRLIQVNYSFSLVEDKRGFIETIDYRRDTIITIAKGPFGSHSEHPVGALRRLTLSDSKPAALRSACAAQG